MRPSGGVDGSWRPPSSRRPLHRDGAGDQRSYLLSILRDLRLEIDDAALLGLIGCLLTREGLRQQEMVSCIGERSFALPRLGVDLPLTEFERSLFDVVLDLELTQTLAGGVVVMGRSLTAKFEGALSDAVRQVRNLGRHPGEGGGVAVESRAQIPPKPAQRIADGVGWFPRLAAALTFRIAIAARSTSP